MRTLGTRLSFLVVPWVMLAAGAHWSVVAIVSAAQLAGYLVVFTRRPLGVYADIGSVAVLGAIAFAVDNVIIVAVLAALLGALRGLRAGTLAPSASEGPPREGLIRVLLVAAGLAAGAVAMWLGPLGALWVNAMIFAVSAVLGVKPSVSEAATVLPRDRLVGRLALNLFATNLLTQTAAVLLVVFWVKEVARAPQLLGLAAAAFALGMLGLGLRHAIFAAGVVAGGAALFLLGDRPPVLLLVVVASFVAGAALASVDPVVDTPLRKAGYAGIPLGTGVAAWSLSYVNLPAALGIAAGLYLIALLIPVLAFRDWRQLLPDPPALPVTPGKLPGRLTVTMVYANGQWVVEVRKGRALLGSRHLVKSSEALSMLGLLEVPGVAETVQKALSTDKVEAARQAERVRNELSELESKLAGLTEMTELNDLREGSDARSTLPSV